TEDPQIAGDIVLDGTITASGGGSTWTMKGTSTGEAGAQSVQGKGSMNVTALSVNSSVAFLNSLSSFTVETLTGAGTFINDANANLYIKGNATISNLIATASLNTVSYSGTSTQVAKGTTYYSLVFNNTTITSPQITFNGNVNVIHDLTMTKGKINLAGYSFTLGIPGAESILSRAASTISNWFYGGTFTRCWLSGIAVTSTSGNCYGLFPVGEPAASTYSPLEINSTSNPVSDGKFSVLYSPVPGKGTDLDPVYNDGGKNIERILNSSFLTSAEGIDGGTYNISVSMTGVNSAGSIGDIRLAVYTGGTTAGVVGMHAAATGSVTKPTAKRTGLNMSDLAGKDFRIATIDKGATPLPVQFISFSAKQDGSRAELSWVTASELNSDHFLVQRSKNGIDFETIANVDAAGCSSVQKKYSILDYDPVEGVSYYRLKEVDYNGEFIFSGVAAVNFFLEKEISVYPDPADGWFSVSGLQLPALIQIFNLSGGKVLETTLREEQSVIHLNAEGGIYFLKATSGAKVFEKKIILK
ncbi:MAG TPA: T9SS type A sorting domain-containing protein, partial [Bacteroidia bacterium]